jgi:hypothetical protein
VEELEELERYLSAATILTWGEAVTEGGHPEKHRVLLAGGVQVMAKPGHDNLGAVVRREAAGWQVAKHLGFVGLVAATVLRDVPRLSTGEDVVSSVQITWPDGRQWLTPLDQLPEQEVWKAAVFDAVVAHADHNNNNWFGVPEPSAAGGAHLRLVDTGNAFDIGAGAVNSSFYQHHLDEHLPDDIRESVRHFGESPRPEIEELLGQDETERVRDRAEQIADSGVLRVGSE